MSYFGKLALEEIDRRWAEGQRVGKVHPWERREILSGARGPIHRELEPSFEEGQEFVLRWQRAERQAIYDIYDPMKLTGDVVRVPRQPLFTITIREKKRHRLGGWVVHFDVWRQDSAAMLVRRKPPSSGGARVEDATPDEIARASIESNYTHNPKQALDHLPSVPPEYQNILDMQAKERRADDLSQRRADRDEQEARDDIKRAHARLKSMVLGEIRAGRDPKILLASVQQSMAEYERHLKAAA